MAEWMPPASIDAMQLTRPLLVVFDFDFTLIDCNSDTVAFNQLPYGQPLVPRFTSLRKEQGMRWTQIMQTQLAELAAQEGYSKADLLACMRDVKMNSTLIRALRALRHIQEPPIKLVIASDANTVFIEEILAANGLGKEDFAAIYTNSGSWAANDVLQVEPYQPIDVAHDCPRLCPPNMCKTTILQRALRDLSLDDVADLQTMYVGDGGNDYCPSLTLRATDLVFVREGFALQKLIQKEHTGEQVEQTKSESLEPQVSAEQPASPAKATMKESTNSQPSQKVIAQTRFWKTQEQLGQMLLELIGEGPPQLQHLSMQTLPDNSSGDMEQNLAQMTIGKTLTYRQSSNRYLHFVQGRHPSKLARKWLGPSC